MPVPRKWYDEKAADNSQWLRALAELRQLAAREGHCFQHVQAITVAIDQYAEKALRNRDYFPQQALQHWRVQESQRRVATLTRLPL